MFNVGPAVVVPYRISGPGSINSDLIIYPLSYIQTESVRPASIEELSGGLTRRSIPPAEPDWSPTEDPAKNDGAAPWRLLEV